jgi:nitrogen regulatory protein P-II 1
MKRIEAIIQPHKLGAVITALHELPHFPGFTVFDGHGQGHGRGKGGVFAYDNNEGLLYHRRRILVVLCETAIASSIVQTIINAAHTGQPGDGLITVFDVETTIRIGKPEDRA